MDNRGPMPQVKKAQFNAVLQRMRERRNSRNYEQKPVAAPKNPRLVTDDEAFRHRIARIRQSYGNEVTMTIPKQLPQQLLKQTEKMLNSANALREKVNASQRQSDAEPAEASNTLLNDPMVMPMTPSSVPIMANVAHKREMWNTFQKEFNARRSSCPPTPPMLHAKSPTTVNAPKTPIAREEAQYIPSLTVETGQDHVKETSQSERPIALKAPSKPSLKNEAPPQNGEETKGYKAMTEEEFRVVDYLEKREQAFVRIIQHNEGVMKKAIQDFSASKRQMQTKMQDMISIMTHEMANMQRELSTQMNDIQSQVQQEAKQMRESIKKCQSLKASIKKGIEQPIASWEDLRKRSSELARKSEQILGRETVQTLENIEFPKIDFDAIVEGFTHQIHNEVGIESTFEENVLKKMGVIGEEPKTRVTKVKAIPNVETKKRGRETSTEWTKSGEITETRHLTREFNPNMNFNVMGITKESDMYIMRVKANINAIERGDGVRDTQWTMIPKPKRGMVESVKYPSMVFHSQRKELYRFGGVIGGKQVNEALKYDFPSNEWSHLASSPIAIQDAVSLLLNDSNIITLGGASKVKNRSSDGAGWKVHNAVSIYNLDTDSWPSVHFSDKKFSPMNDPRYAFAALNMLSQDKVMVFSGNGPRGRTATTEMYDHQENQWKYLRDIPVVKSRHSAVWYGEHALIAGGDSKSKSKECFQYDLRRNQWFQESSLNEDRINPVLLSVLDKSCVIAAGGGGKLKTFEILDKRMQQAKWMMTTVEDHPDMVVFKAGMIALVR